MATLEDRLTLAAFNAATEGRGNVKLVWGSYVGNGEQGQEHPTTLIFDGRPLWVRIRRAVTSLTTLHINFYYGCTEVEKNFNGPSVTAAWNENNLSFYAPSGGSGDQMNAPDIPYYYIALVGM